MKRSTDPLTWFVRVLGVLGLGTLVRVFLTARLRLPLNFNEGWNAFHSADLASGRPLYPDPSGFFFNNYPPLSFYPVAAAGRLAGDHLVGGRIVALLALVAWVVLLVVVARRLGCKWPESVFCALLFGLQLSVFSDFYVGVDDPQILGHALQATGLVLLLGERRTTGRLLLSALMFAAGVFTKQNLIALPLASLLWLAMTDRRSAWRLAAFGALAAAAGVLVCVVAYGPGFLGQIGAARGYEAAKAMSMSAQWLVRMPVFVVLAAVLLRRCGRDASVSFALTYSIVAILAGLGLSGGDGVYWNVMFDAEWALCLTAALALNRLAPNSSGTAARVRLGMAAAFVAAPVIVLAMSATIHWLSPRFWLDPRWSEAETAGREIDFVRRHPGPALCENLAICYWADKSVEADFFNLQQRARREPWRTDALARAIESRRFAVVLVDEPGRDLGAAVTRALREHYRVDHESQWGRFLVPASGDFVQQPPR